MELTDFPPEIIEKICSNLSIKDAIEMYNTHNKCIQYSIKYTFMNIIKNEEYLDKTTGNPNYDEPGLKQCIRDQFYGRCKKEDLDNYYDNESYISPDFNTILWNKFKRIAKYFSNNSKEWRDEQNDFLIENDWYTYYLDYAEFCILYELHPDIFIQINKQGDEYFLRRNSIDKKTIKIWIDKLKPFSLKEIKCITKFHFVVGGISLDTYDYFYQIKQKIPEADFLKFLKYSSYNFREHCFTSIDMLFLIKLIIECDMKVNNVIKIFKKLPEVFEGNKFKYGNDKTRPTEEMQRLIDSYKKKLA